MWVCSPYWSRKKRKNDGYMTEEMINKIKDKIEQHRLAKREKEKIPYTMETINAEIEQNKKNKEAQKNRDYSDDDNGYKECREAKQARQHLQKSNRCKKLMKMGFDVKPHTHGYLVNDKYMVAAIQKKWRVVGRATWYWFKDIKDLSKYFNS